MLETVMGVLLGLASAIAMLLASVLAIPDYLRYRRSNSM